jgi:class 3 adenylate cyclase/tetratricopeptide (TPR) repeat protein
MLSVAKTIEDGAVDIAGWLGGLGLAQYVRAFAENDIDEEVLQRLTAEDLRDIGVKSVGHRRRLLDAIAALGLQPVPAAGAREATPVSEISQEAERRQLTVMFCDLVGSTALSSRFDPEDLREIIGAYHGCVAETVARFGGFVAKYMGDGVLIYFGYPQAHEDDAERAVRAGLAVIAAVARLDMPDRIAVRLGLASGLVVVGDLIGEGAAQERGVVGETPNLAARLQALAEPGAVVIADSTRRQIGRLFEVEDLGPQSLAGFTEPQRAWSVVGESAVASRFEALRSQSAKLVGREEEVELLLRRWERAKSGDGRVVLVSGEPGIGKSRLSVELVDRISGERHTRLRYYCSPHHQDSPLYPFILQLERAAALTRGDSPEEKRAKLEGLISPAAADPDEVSLLSELLSLPNTAANLNLSPQKRREKLFGALLRQLEAIARREPVLLLFEDAHWIDPTSRELMDLTIDRIQRLPVLLVITFRPEFQHGWSGQPHVTELPLNRLAGRDGVALVEALSGSMALPSEIVADIVDRTDGVPLFVEELTKAVLETADREDRVAAVLSTGPSASLAIPATLHSSLIARLDRLGVAAKEVAQIGAVLGREFSYELIEAVAERPRTELDAGLGQLADAGLLFCRGVVPHSSYLFKHALVQDAAYGTLLRTRRQQLHGRVAAVLQQHFPDVVERQPELLAHHLTGAGETASAIEQWQRAGQHAADRLAHREAIRHYERGLALVPMLPEGRSRNSQEIQLQLARGSSLFTTEGFGANGAVDIYSRARELAEQEGDRVQQFLAAYGLWQSANGHGNIIDCRRLSRRLEELSENDPDDELRLQAHHSAWATCLFSGEPQKALEHSEIGRHLYDPERHHSQQQLYGGHDPGMCAHQFGALALWLLGYPDAGSALGAKAVELAERIAHPFSFAISLQFYSMLQVDRGEPEIALHHLAVSEAVVEQQRFGFVVEPELLRGAALLAQGALSDAITLLRQGLLRPGATRMRCYGLAKLAEALTRTGQHTEALAAASDGLAIAEQTGQRQWEAELHRVDGIARWHAGQPREAEAAFQRSLRIARRQRAKSYELRTATSLARVLAEQGRRFEALDLLGPIRGWFTEGFDTVDLKEAAALLVQLG